MGQQDYSNIKKGLTEIAKDESAGSAARYAQFVLQQVEGYELAMAVNKEIQLQTDQLAKTKAGIQKARTTRLSEVEDLGRFAIKGQLQPYATFGPGHYRIVNEAGKMICYALPEGPAAQKDLTPLIGHQVGLVGTIEAFKPTAGALVRFTDVVELK